jgi:putative nucleotidyltransferase with HDIG domain
MPNDHIKVLLVCDKEESANYLQDKLINDVGVHSVCLRLDGPQALEAMKENSFDVVIVRAQPMDPRTGDLIKNLKKIDPAATIIGFLDAGNPELERELSLWGSYECLTMPLDDWKMDFLIRKGAELHSALFSSCKYINGLKECNAALEKQNAAFSHRIEESTKNLTRLYEDLRTTYMRTIKVLAQAIDARDHYTHSHSEGVARFAVAIAQELMLSARDIENIREACELHDLGKIGVDDAILTKTTSLNEFEWEQIKRHPSVGASILEPLTFLRDVIELVRQHHEHYDGKGYPEGRSGEDILLGARIIHLADAYESMRSPRSYRKTPLTKEEAIKEIQSNKGTQFDPGVVEAFLGIVDQLT